ncbi:MAG: efflux RND transporter periplasmic adaptor subunit [Rhodobiaceae bacterium]|nr:efflux RND transporter periplasmic adaptor subunit [Rhodobiaceae bacterium]MCC0016501.1 efflux RND transporter periplasmic adaptor subunit [Rhodobiaceae bacterium]
MLTIRTIRRVASVIALLTLPAQVLAQGAPPPQPVTVVTLQPQDVTLTATLPGRVVASGVAEVRPQVSGIITERLFDEGGDVAVGDELYRIDPETYRVRVVAAKAQVAQAEAQLRAAEREADRLRVLIERKVASERSFDEAQAALETASAAVDVAKADQLAAEIDYERTTIRAQLSGVIGRSLTTRGALVTSGQAEPLAVIRTLDPVLVDVTQSAAELIAWRRGIVAKRLEGAAQDVSLKLADGGTYEHVGSLTAADPYVNELTGVVTLRLEFPNPDRLLLPGMYVQVDMPQGVLHAVFLVPQEAVQRDQRGRPTVFAVKADNTVEQKALAVSQARGNDWIVTEGLAPGDRVIVEGLQKVRPGASVAPDERASPGS